MSNSFNKIALPSFSISYDASVFTSLKCFSLHKRLNGVQYFETLLLRHLKAFNFEHFNIFCKFQTICPAPLTEILKIICSLVFKKKSFFACYEREVSFVERFEAANLASVEPGLGRLFDLLNFTHLAKCLFHNTCTVLRGQCWPKTWSRASDCSACPYPRRTTSRAHPRLVPLSPVARHHLDK